MNDFRHQEFGNRIRRWRQDLQPPMTQRELANRIGVSNGFLAHIETGRTLPGIRTLRALAKALGIAETEMLREAGYLSTAPTKGSEQLLDDPELREFFRDDWGQLTGDEKEWLKDFVRLLKARRKPGPGG
jgi:transcriptional regulator with XRE-family HTH domain